MQDYKYISENTLTDVSLHDCGCEKIYMAGSDLVFNMEFMEICSEHELNPFPLAHQTTEGQIVFKNVEIKKCLLDDSDVSPDQFGADSTYSNNLIILDYAEKAFGKQYSAELNMLPGGDYQFLYIEITFEKSIIMWNAFTRVSWFESFNKGQFLWNEIRPLLDSEGKTFLQKQNDLYVAINMVYKTREKGSGYSEKAYKHVLGKAFYNHELLDVEEEFIINFFKCLIIRHSELDIFCIGCLGKYPTEDEYKFLFEQLKRSIWEDECLAVAFLRELNSWNSTEYIDYLAAIQTSDKLSSNLKDYISQIIKFKTREITNMSEPSVKYDNNGKNRHIKWGRD